MVSATVFPALLSLDNFSVDASFTFYCLGSFFFSSKLASSIDRFFSKFSNSFRLSGFLVLSRKCCEAQLRLCVINLLLRKSGC